MKPTTAERVGGQSAVPVEERGRGDALRARRTPLRPSRSRVSASSASTLPRRQEASVSQVPFSSSWAHGSLKLTPPHDRRVATTQQAGQVFERYLTQMATSTATLGSLVAFILLGQDAADEVPAWRWSLIAVALLAFVVNLSVDWSAYRAATAKRFRASREIRDYMRALLDRGGRSAIFSRDLTWADHSDVKDVLLEKARRGELTIVLPRVVPVATELASAGAALFTYPALDYELRSRFTLVQLGTAAPSVAVGRPQGEHVYVEEFNERTHPVVTLAEDLHQVLKRISTPVRPASGSST